MKYGKLVRDKIPEIIRSNGEIPIYHTLENEKMKNQLFIKLMEEYKETIHAYLEYQKGCQCGIMNNSDTLQELGDMLEVIVSLGHIDGIEEQEIVYLSRCEEIEVEDIATCLAQLKRCILHIYKVRQIHKQDYINIVQLMMILARHVHLTELNVIQAMVQKREARGGFQKRIYLDNVVKMNT